MKHMVPATSAETAKHAGWRSVGTMDDGGLQPLSAGQGVLMSSVSSGVPTFLALLIRAWRECLILKM